MLERRPEDRAVKFRDYQRSMEHEYWLFMALFCRGNVCQMSRVSGLTRSLVYRNLKLYGVRIERPAIGRPKRQAKPVPAWPVSYADSSLLQQTPARSDARPAPPALRPSLRATQSSMGRV